MAKKFITFLILCTFSFTEISKLNCTQCMKITDNLVEGDSIQFENDTLSDYKSARVVT